MAGRNPASSPSSPAPASVDTLTKFCVVEFNFYHGVGNTWVVKELAVACFPDMRRQHWVFQKPYESNYLTHETEEKNAAISQRIKYMWDHGDVPYTSLTRILDESVSSQSGPVFVSGHEKCRFVADILCRPVINFANLYANLKYSINIGAVSPHEYDYASTCIRHDDIKDRDICAKSRCTHMCEMIKMHTRAIRSGKACLETVVPFLDDKEREQKYNKEYHHPQQKQPTRSRYRFSNNRFVSCFARDSTSKADVVDSPVVNDLRLSSSSSSSSSSIASIDDDDDDDADNNNNNNKKEQNCNCCTSVPVPDADPKQRGGDGQTRI